MPILEQMKKNPGNKDKYYNFEFQSLSQLRDTGCTKTNADALAWTVG